MTTNQVQVQVQDQWAQWLLQRRHGGDPEVLQAMLSTLSQVRDTVLQNARVAQGNTLLDIGCGDGLIAFGALPLVGEQGKVIFCDISQNLLDHCHTLAQQMGVLDHCQFLQASADDGRNSGRKLRLRWLEGACRLSDIAEFGKTPGGHSAFLDQSSHALFIEFRPFLIVGAGSELSRVPLIIDAFNETVDPAIAQRFV